MSNEYFVYDMRLQINLLQVFNYLITLESFNVVLLKIINYQFKKKILLFIKIFILIVNKRGFIIY